MVHIHVVDPDRVVPEQYFARTRIAEFDIDHAEYLRATGVRKLHRARPDRHLCNPFAAVVRRRLLLAIAKGLRAKEMFEVVLSVGRTSAPLLLLLFTAQLYSRTLSMTGITGAAKAFFLASGLGPYEVLAIMVGVWFVLGCLIDSISIILLTVPVFAPIAMALGFDPIAFGILGILAIEVGLLTPPFGILVFTVRAVLPQEASVGEIFRACVPYWVCLMAVIATIALYPQLATWLPNLGR